MTHAIDQARRKLRAVASAALVGAGGALGQRTPAETAAAGTPVIAALLALVVDRLGAVRDDHRGTAAAEGRACVTVEFREDATLVHIPLGNGRLPTHVATRCDP